jgi:hypothetical protein
MAPGGPILGGRALPPNSSRPGQMVAPGQVLWSGPPVSTLATRPPPLTTPANRWTLSGLWRTVNDHILSTSCRLASNPAASLIAGAGILAMFPFIEPGFDPHTTVPADLVDVLHAFTLDPQSGFAPIAGLSLGELYLVEKHHWTDIRLPKTKLSSESALRSAFANGLATLIMGNPARAAEHFHQHARIARNRKASPDEIAEAYAMRTFALELDGQHKEARKNRRYWEKLYYTVHPRPNGWWRHRRAFVSLTFHEHVAAVLDASHVGSPVRRLALQLHAYDAIATAHGTMGNDDAQEAAVKTCSILHDRMTALESASAMPTSPHLATFAEIEAMATIPPLEDTPEHRAAAHAVEYLLRHTTDTPTDATRRQWANIFYASAAEFYAQRQGFAEAAQRHQLDHALIFEMLAYGLMTDHHRPFMNDFIAQTAPYLVAVQSTYNTHETADLVATLDLLTLHRSAQILSLLTDAARTYRSIGLDEELARIEPARAHVEQIADQANVRITMEISRLLKDGQSRQAARMLESWTLHHYQGNAADSQIRAGLAPMHARRFDQAVCIETVGNRLRRSPSPTILAQAAETLREAQHLFADLGMDRRVRRLDHLLAGLAKAAHESGARQHGRRAASHRAAAVASRDFHRSARDLIDQALQKAKDDDA